MKKKKKKTYLPHPDNNSVAWDAYIDSLSHKKAKKMLRYLRQVYLSQAESTEVSRREIDRLADEMRSTYGEFLDERKKNSRLFSVAALGWCMGPPIGVLVVWLVTMWEVLSP